MRAAVTRKPPTDPTRGAQRLSPEQLRQLGDVRRDPPRLIAGQQLRRRSPAGLILEIDVGERLAGVVLHDEAGVRFLDDPRGGRRCPGPASYGARSGSPSLSTPSMLRTAYSSCLTSQISPIWGPRIHSTQDVRARKTACALFEARDRMSRSAGMPAEGDRPFTRSDREENFRRRMAAYPRSSIPCLGEAIL
jgi:hypothetical protein